MKHLDVKVATHNLGDKPKRDVIGALFDRGAVLVAVQEAADQRPDDFDLPDWVGMYWPLGADAAENRGENPLLWDRRAFRKVRADSRFLTDRKDVGHEGAGGDVMHIKNLNWVTLEHKVLERQMTFGNMHTVPSIRANEARGDLMRAQIDGAVRWANARRQARILTLMGDLNADWRHPADNAFLRPLWEAGFRHCWEATKTDGASLGNRQIDYVALRKNEDARIVGMGVPHLGFDHKPVLTTIRVKAA